MIILRTHNKQNVNQKFYHIDVLSNFTYVITSLKTQSKFKERKFVKFIFKMYANAFELTYKS